MLFRRTDDIGYILESAMLMELGLRTNRNVMLYRCVLVRLYFHWNCLSSAYHSCISNVENVLLEPMSQDILSEILSIPWAGLTKFLQDSMKFVDDQIFLCGETASHFFQMGAYLQAMEKIYFKDTLQHSVIYAILQTETPISKLKHDSCDINDFEGTLEAEGFGIPSLELVDEITKNYLVCSKDLNKQHPWIAFLSDELYISEAFEVDLYWPFENMVGDLKYALNKRLLLPRLLYLSLRSASTFISQFIHEESDTSHLPQLRTLLERYTPLGLHITDAVQLLAQVALGCKPFKALEPHILQWMTYVVFLNAWNLSSGEISISDRDPSLFIFWRLTINLLTRYIDEFIDNAQPLISFGATVVHLAQLVSEPLSWHAIVVQRSIKSLLLEKERADKPSDSIFYLLLSQELTGLSESILASLTRVIEWITEETIKGHDVRLEEMESKINVKDGRDGPGKEAQIVDLYSGMDESLKLFHSKKVVARIINALNISLSDFGKLCKAKKLQLEEFIKEFILQSCL